jgi:Protein of unknown function (DUF2804)
MSAAHGPAPLDRQYRGDGLGRPQGVPIPPDRLPLLRRGQLRKRWHYVSFWSSELILCAARVQVGPLSHDYFGVWDRVARRLSKGQGFLRRRVHMPPRRVIVEDDDVAIDLALRATDAFQVYRPEHRAYIWSYKELCREAVATVRLGGATREVVGTAFVDVNAGYHSRRTRWRWMAGAGTDEAGTAVAWNAIVGLFDTPANSERTVWVDGRPAEVGPVRFSEDLTSVSFAEGGELRFREEAVLRKRFGLFLLSSRYDHSFGVYSGTLPGGVAVHEGFGVRECQDALW